MGPAGLTIVIVREDLLGRFDSCPFKGPLMLDYKICADNGSMYNTPPTFPIYVSGLVFQWVIDLGGIKGIEQLNLKKSTLLYQTLESYPNLIRFPVARKEYRSRMNVPFRLLKDGQPDEALEKEFLKKAEERGCTQLAGHRSVGGIRASLYNALPIEAVQVLVDLIHSFAKEY